MKGLILTTLLSLLAGFTIETPCNYAASFELTLELTDTDSSVIELYTGL